MQVLRLVTQMLDAMLYLYDMHGIVHRDIKPENILVFKEPFVYRGIEDAFYRSIERESEIVFKLCGSRAGLSSRSDFGFSGKDKCRCGTECGCRARD